MKFTKMHGAGNDFIIINAMQEQIAPERIPELARVLCSRRTGIGADGLMLTDHPTDGGDFKLLFYNADGSLGEMCGNGARCIARYGYEHGLSGDKANIETTAGLVTGERISETQYRIRLNDPASSICTGRPAASTARTLSWEIRVFPTPSSWWMTGTKSRKMSCAGWGGHCALTRPSPRALM